MKKISILGLVLFLFLCSMAMAYQGGGGESKSTTNKAPTPIKKKTPARTGRHTGRSAAPAPTREPEEVDEIEAVAAPPAGYVLESECYTPCTLNVGYSKNIRTGGKPVWIKFPGKSEWFSLYDSEHQQIPAEKFNPGDSQFVAQDQSNTRVHVQIFTAATARATPAPIREPVDSPAPAGYVLESECYTPCRLNVGYSKNIRTGGKAVWIKFPGKSEWFLLTGNESQQIPADKFNPGDSEFVAQDQSNPRVRVKIFTAAVAASAVPGRVMESECYTPCTMELGYSRKILTGSQPVWIKFYGKTEWYYLTGRDDQQIPADKFNPGAAQFVAPDQKSPRVHVQIYK